MPLKIAKYCAVPGCGRTQSLHNLPSDCDIRNAWLTFIFKDVPAQVGKTLSVCSLHFTADSFLNKAQVDAGFAERLRLKSNAVPSILNRTGMAQQFCVMDRSSSVTAGKSLVVKTKKPLTPEGRRAKIESDRRHTETRINIGRAFPMWRKLREQQSFKSDSELAFFLLNSVCDEHLLALRNKRRLKKSTHVPAPQMEEPESDLSHPSEDHQSSDEDTEVPEICYEVPHPCETDEVEQTEMKSEDPLKSEDELLDQDVCKDSCIPTLHNGNIVPQCSISHTTTVKEEPVETELQPEGRLEVSTSPAATSDKIDHSFVRTPNPVMVENRVGHRDRSLVSKKSHLTGLFPTCLQCGGPVLEYTTMSSGSQNRLQWKCSKGHLMWLFPNSNPT